MHIPSLFKPYLFLPLAVLVSVPAVGQTQNLAVGPEDIRLEIAHLDGEAGHLLSVRKKPGVESVMLTEPSGYHALRSAAWNAVNGDEARALSGKILSGDDARYSIVSSTPVTDWQFGTAFQLFIPTKVLYGNPSSASGTVFIDIREGVQFNIRTFDHKYADPHVGRLRNNLFRFINVPNH